MTTDYEPTKAGFAWIAMLSIIAIAWIATSVVNAGPNTDDEYAPPNPWLLIPVSIVGIIIAIILERKCRLDTILFALFAMSYAHTLIGRWLA